MKIKDMMHKGLECVSQGASISTVAQKMQQFDVGAIPVADDGKLIGMITDRDIVIRCLAKGKDCSRLAAKDVMTGDVVYCRDTEEAEDAIRLMEKSKFAGFRCLMRKSEWWV